MKAIRTAPITTLDTGEEISAAVVLSDCHEADGYAWMDLIEPHGWAAIANWGTDGWSLGRWPSAVVAATHTADSTGKLFGVASYCDGAVTCTYFRTEARQWDEITKHAQYWWKNGPAPAPVDLPEHAADLPSRYRQPYTGVFN